MGKVTKVIYGAGTSNNPVKVQVACDDLRAIIPFVVKVVDDTDPCDIKIEYESHSKDITNDITIDHECDCREKITGDCDTYEDYDKKTGNFTYDGLTVYYELEFIAEPCPDTPDCTTECKLGNYWITKNDKNLTISYEKYTITDCGDYGDVKREIKKVTKTCTSDTITITDACGSFSFKYECVEPCTNPGSTIINVRGAAFDPLVVEYSGGNIQVSISYEKIIVDKDCTEHKSRGSAILSATVDPCSAEMCCFDHDAEVKIKKTDLLTALGLDNTVIVKYKGQTVGEYLTLSIVQKANPGPECNTDCEYKITYCVLHGGGHDIKVEYETYWGSRDWSGTEVSPAGGRVRVSFDYHATAIAIDSSGNPITDKDGYQINPDGTRKKDKDNKDILEKICKPYEFNGNDYVIVEVPPCITEEATTAVTTGDTLVGEILYKERSEWCGSGTCVDETTVPCVGEYEYTDIVTKEKYKMNLIRYEINQSCTGDCNPYDYIKYGEATATADPCDTTASATTPYTAYTVTEDCKLLVKETGSTTITVPIEINQTNKERTIHTEYFDVTQSAGPCYTGESCGCDALVIYSGNYGDLCDCDRALTIGTENEQDGECDPEDFDCYLNYFNNNLTGKINKKITKSATPKTYSYLRSLYDEAYKQFYNVSEGRKLPYLYADNAKLPDLYPDLMFGTTKDEDQAFDAMVGFLLAMALTEINPDQDHSSDFYTVGYNIGTNNRNVQLYGKYAYHSDPNIARLMASVIYAGLRPKTANYIDKVAEMRNEIGGKQFDYTIRQYRTSTTPAIDWDDIIITAGALNRFFPYAPGPYCTDPGCNNNPVYEVYRNDARVSDTNYNLKVDDTINRRIVGNITGYEPYILTNATNSARTAQAIADKETCGYHLFGSSRTVTVDGVTYTINPVFNDGIDSSKDNIRELAEDVGRIAEDSRYAGSRTKGRFRPGRYGFVDPSSYANGKFLCNVEIQSADGCPPSGYNALGERINFDASDPDICTTENREYSGSTSSFPSGHSARIWAVTLMLINLKPELAVKLMKEGYVYSVNRTIARYHWNSDIINGRLIGAISYPILTATKDYNKDFLSKCEWQGDTPTPPEPTTDCICTGVKGEFNYGDGAYDSGETTDISVKVGSGRTGTNCSGIVIKATKIKVYNPQNNDSELPASSAAVASIDDVRVDMSPDNTTYTVYAKMRKYPDTTLATTKTRIYFNVLEYKKESEPEQGTEESYINIYQKKED